MRPFDLHAPRHSSHGAAGKGAAPENTFSHTHTHTDTHTHEHTHARHVWYNSD